MEMNGQLYALYILLLARVLRPLPLNRGLSQPHNWSRCFGEENKILLPLPAVHPRLLGYPALFLVIVPSNPSHFRCVSDVTVIDSC